MLVSTLIALILAQYFLIHGEVIKQQKIKTFKFVYRLSQMNDSNFTPVFLQSHGIRVDRGQDYLNISCLADFLVDKKTMDESLIDLLEQIKDKTLFNLNMRLNLFENSNKQSWVRF